MVHLSLVASLVIPAALSRASQPSEPVIEQIAALSELYSAVLEEGERLGLEGRLGEANRRVLDFVPESARTAAHNFYLGNLFYRSDFELSYRLHEAAYRARPHDPHTTLEWALQNHRKQRFAAAIDLYRAYLQAIPDHAAIQALLADCYLNTGAYDEAVNAWAAANHAQNHTGIDSVIHWIYGEAAPQQRRSELLRALREGDQSMVEALILLDLQWDQDWWNRKVRADALEYDLEAVDRAIGSDSERSRAIRTLVEITTEDLEKEALQAVLEERGYLLGRNARLPSVSMVARAMVEAAVRKGVVGSVALADRFEEELLSRANSVDGDSNALHLLAALRVGDSQRLEELDRLGWEKFGDARFAASYLVGKAETLQLSDPELTRASEQFPLDSVIAYVVLETAQREGKVTPLVVANALKAEYRSLALSSFLGGMRDSYSLKLLFAKLETALEKSPTEK